MTSDETLITPIGIGYWKSDREQSMPDPKKFINSSVSEADRISLIKYLLRGKTFISYLGFSFCRFDCGINDSEMGARCMTDGKYVWPEGLVHYIDKHQIWLPDNFVQHSKSNFDFDPDLINLKKMKLFDLDWWKGFAK
jgi:hypothetical protein